MTPDQLPMPTDPARFPLQAAPAPLPVQKAEGPPPALSLRVIVRGFSRHWWQILLIWGVCSAAAAGVIYTKVKPTYDVSGVIQVEPAEQNLFGGGASAVRGFEAYLETQVELLKSNSILLEASSDPEAMKSDLFRNAKDVVGELHGLIQAWNKPGTYMIVVSMRSPSAKDAASIVNAVMTSYFNAAKSRTSYKKDRLIRRLNQYRDGLLEEMKPLKEKWKEIAAKGYVDPPSRRDEKKSEKATAADGPETASTGGGEEEPSSGDAPLGRRHRDITLEEYSLTRKKLLQVNLDLIEAEAQIGRRREAADRPEGHGEAAVEREAAAQRLRREVESAFLQLPNVIELKQKIREAEDKIERGKRLAKSTTDPSLTAARRQLAALNVDYQRLWIQEQPILRDRLASFRAPEAAKRPHEDAQARVESLRAAKAAYEETLENIKIINQQEGTDAVDVLFIREDLDNMHRMREAVDRRIEELKFEALKLDTIETEPGHAKGKEDQTVLVDGVQISIVDRAREQGNPMSSGRTKMLAAAPIGLFLAVAGLFVLLEIRAGRVGDPDELSTRVGAQVFLVPPLPVAHPTPSLPGHPALREQYDHFMQSLDHLRVALCREATDGGGHCLMITSATGREGKTTLAAQLAGRCAGTGLFTLLIDADLRRPRLGELLEVPEGPGLADVLLGEIEPEAAVVPIDSAGGFHLLSAGTPGHDPCRILQGPRLVELLARLRQTYDVVIVDTPPVLPVPDALIVGRRTQGAILAVRYDTSRFPLVAKAQKLLEAAGIPVMGTVINGVRATEAAYGAYAYHQS